MSNFQQRDNSGALFKNDRKEQEKHPDYKGDALIDGVAYEIGAWIKEGRNGKKFMSLSFKPKQGDAAAPQQDTRRGSAHPPSSGYMDEEIPFSPSVL